MIPADRDRVVQQHVDAAGTPGGEAHDGAVGHRLSDGGLDRGDVGGHDLFDAPCAHVHGLYRGSVDDPARLVAPRPVCEEPGTQQWTLLVREPPEHRSDLFRRRLADRPMLWEGDAEAGGRYRAVRQELEGLDDGEPVVLGAGIEACADDPHSPVRGGEAVYRTVPVPVVVMLDEIDSARGAGRQLDLGGRVGAVERWVGVEAASVKADDIIERHRPSTPVTGSQVEERAAPGAYLRVGIDIEHVHDVPVADTRSELGLDVRLLHEDTDRPVLRDRHRDANLGHFHPLTYRAWARRGRGSQSDARTRTHQADHHDVSEQSPHRPPLRADAPSSPPRPAGQGPDGPAACLRHGGDDQSSYAYAWRHSPTRQPRRSACRRSSRRAVRPLTR